MRFLKIFFAILPVLAAFSCKNTTPNVKSAGFLPEPSKPTTSPFAGQWQWTKNSDRNTFSVSFSQKNDSLIGFYCTVARGGAKIDCADEAGESFKVPLPPGNTFEVEFTSNFSGEKGKAKFLLDSGKLNWWITQVPKGEFYAPVDAILVRDTLH